MFAGHYQNMNLNSSSQDTANTPNQAPLLEPEQQFSAFSSGDGCSEDPMGYLEPVKIRINDSFFDQDGINCDLSQIEGSVVDSDFWPNYCKKEPPITPPAINVEKYKIKNCDSSRLSAVSNDTKPGEFTESEYSDGELFRLTEKEKMLQSENEYEELPEAPPIPKTLSDENFYNKLENTDTIQRNLKCNNESPPKMNDLNKEGIVSSKNSLNISTPNIKYKTDSIISEDSNTLTASDASIQRSMPNIASSSSSSSSSTDSSATASPSRGSPTRDTEEEDPSLNKINQAFTKDNGLISLYHGKTDNKRFSTATENAMKANNVRFSSSDC